MKKILVVLLIAVMAMVCVGCKIRDTADITNTAIPNHVSYIAFYNGSDCIGEYENANVAVVMEETAHRNFLKDDTIVTFYTYIISCSGQPDDYIIDSEALSIKYRK